MRNTVRSLSVLSGAVGLGVFAWIMGRTGLAAVIENARLLGAGFVALVVLAGARHCLRTICWRRCVDAGQPAPGFLDLFRLRLIGEAFDDLTPAGPLVGEPIKVWATSKHMPFEVSASSVIIEDMLYCLGVCLFVLSGAVLFLIKDANLQDFRWLAAALGASLLVMVLFLDYVVKRGTLSFEKVFDSLCRSRMGKRFLNQYTQKICILERAIRTFFVTRRKLFFHIFGIELATNFIGVADAYVILRATTAHASLPSAFLIESATRAATLGLAFVPFGLGLMEGVAGATFLALGYAASDGVSLVLFRRVRTFFWAVLGLLLASRYAVNTLMQERRVE